MSKHQPVPAAVRYNSGSQVAAALNPVRGLRDQQRRAGQTPVDHARRNLMAIKETQRKLQEEREARSLQQPAEPFKLKKFAAVGSKVSARVEEDTRQAEQRPKHKFLRKGERCKEPAPHVARPGQSPNMEDERRALESAGTTGADTARSGSSQSTRTRIKSKQAVPKANELNELAPRASRNFIQTNARDVLDKAAENRAKQDALRKREESVRERQRHSLGQVPQYLLKRQSELLEEKARLAEQADPDCPPGMVRVSDEERLHTLDALKRNLEETRNELRKFPLTVSSIAQRNRKKELEDKLTEQETAVEIFSKDKVYIYE